MQESVSTFLKNSSHRSILGRHPSRQHLEKHNLSVKGQHDEYKHWGIVVCQGWKGVPNDFKHAMRRFSWENIGFLHVLLSFLCVSPLHHGLTFVSDRIRAWNLFSRGRAGAFCEQDRCHGRPSFQVNGDWDLRIGWPHVEFKVKLLGFCWFSAFICVTITAVSEVKLISWTTWKQTIENNSCFSSSTVKSDWIDLASLCPCWRAL